MPFNAGRTFAAALVMSLLIQWQIAQLGHAARGAKIAFTSTRDGNPDIYVMDADGKHRRRVTTHAAEDGHPSWSPDGKKIAFVSNRNGGYIQIWVIDADGANPIRLTGGVWDQNPVWSPNGKKIAYQAYRKKALNVDFEERNYEIYVMNADGSNKNRLTDRQEFDGHPSWSPDGKKIVYSSRRENRIAEIYVMDVNGRNEKRISQNIKDRENKFMPAWSPDGRRIAFVHDSQIYVMDSNGENQRKITHKRMNRYPTWSPDGTTLAFESWERHGAEHGIYLIDVRGGALTPIGEVHKQGDFQPDWLNTAGLAVSPGTSQISIWGRLKDIGSSLR